MRKNTPDQAFPRALEGQALNQYSRVLSLQIKNKCPDLQEEKKLYTSEEAKTEILDAINDVLEQSVDCDINNSEFIGLIIDESTDVTVHKKLNVYVKCVNEKSESVIHFMDCINVVDGKAETIVSEIVKVFQRKGISLTKLMTLASDGASVMTGRLNGVGVRLKREFSPHMTQIHCVAHKLALAAGQACRDIALFSEYQLTLKNVYRYFSNSAVRYNELRAMQDIMGDEEMAYLTLKEPASFRWLSLDGAVRAVADCYPALYSTLEHDAAKGNSAGNSEAKGLFNKVKCVTFVLVTGFLRDVLSVVSKLSKVFQRDLIDIETVNVMVDATIMKLNQLKNKNGPELSKVYEEMTTTKSMYRGMKLNDREQLRMQFQNNATNYLQKLTENIEDRFDKESMKTLQLLNTLLSLSLIPKNMNGLEDHGEEQLKQLVEICGGEDGIIDGERATEDYYQLKVVLKSLNSSLTEACTTILKQYRDVFPDFATLAAWVLISPVTSVACERGFSVHNKIKTKARSCLKHDTVTKLMRIKEEGPSLKDFDPKPSVRRFCEVRNRRK